MSVTMDMSELLAFSRSLEAAGKRVTGEDSKALTQVAKELKSDAEHLSPVDTGEQKDSFYIRGGKGWRIVGNSSRQAFFNEFGTSTHSPQPSLYPAAARAELQLEKLMGDAGLDALG